MKRKAFVNNRILKVLGTALLLAVLLTPMLTQAQARFPADRGAVTDDANVLSSVMIQEIGEFQSLVQARTGVELQVVVVHFLDGLDAQTYAREMFVRRGMESSDMLLLGAAGEDGFAVASGVQFKENISDNNMQLLLTTSGFGELFKAQRYEEAFGKFFVSFAQTLNKQYGVNMDLGGLFAAYQSGAQPAPTPRPTAPGVGSYFSSLWDSIRDDFDDNAEEYRDYHQRREKEEGGLTPAGWVLLVILIGIVFSQSDPVRKNRRRGGCGCGPLGWIFGIFGITSLFRKRR